MNKVVIVGGTLIDGTGQPPIPEAIIFIAGGRIVNVFRGGEDTIPEGARVINASGKVVTPALMDGHMHVGSLLQGSHIQVDDTMALTELFMHQYIMHGVTTVRDAGNFKPDLLKVFKEERLDWPRLFGAGPILDGPEGDPPYFPNVWLLKTASSVRETVKHLIHGGIDFIKVFIWTRPELIRAAVEEAHSLGVRVAAHVGHIVTVEEAVQLGVDSLEHVRIGRELVAEADLPRLNALPPRALDPLISYRPWRFIDPTSERADRLIDLMAERGVFLVPTLSLAQTVLKSNIPEVMEPPQICVMPQIIRDNWKKKIASFDYTDEDFKQGEVEMTRQMEFIGRAQRGGVKVVAGTDSLNPSVLPGASLHNELRLLVECGLTPMEALVAATSRVSELLGQQNDLGTVEKGKNADILILDGDPLEDIQNTQRIHSVLKSGQVAYHIDATRSQTI